jgi:hypothetical protein
MSILTRMKQQILAIEQARKSIATTTTQLHAMYPDMDIEFLHAQIDVATLAARKNIYDAHKRMERYLLSAITLFKENKITLSQLGFILEGVIAQSEGQFGNFYNSIDQAKIAIVDQAIKEMAQMSLQIDVVLEANHELAEQLQLTSPQLLNTYNKTFDYLIKLGDADLIHSFISARENRFARLKSAAQLEQLIGVMKPESAALLFKQAGELNHLILAKGLQKRLLDKPEFRTAILALGMGNLHHAFASTDWQLADFEVKTMTEYGMAWLMLTQDKLIPQLLAQHKLEDYLNGLDANQLNILFTHFPDKIMAMLADNEINLATRQKLARLLLQLDPKVLGNNVYTLIKLAIFQLDESYNLTLDPENLYKNKLIADYIVANWSGMIPWHTYVNNIYISTNAVSASAFRFILSNIEILAHTNLKKRDLELSIKKAGMYLSPIDYLICINKLRNLNGKKADELLSLLPHFLGTARKLRASHLAAIKELAEQYHCLHPNKLASGRNPLIWALFKNKDFAHKYAILGPLIFDKKNQNELVFFLARAADYKIPDLVPDTIKKGFINGMLMGIAGFGILMVLDKIAGLTNLVNPFAVLQSIPVIGNVMTFLSVGATASLLGGGLLTTLLVIAGPLLVSALVGGVIGALANTGGKSLANQIKIAGTWLANKATNNNDANLEVQAILTHGLNSVDADYLRNELYANHNLEMRTNMAKMLLQQEALGFSLQNIRPEIRAIVEPVRAQYYNANKHIALKISDYLFGNLLSALAWLMKEVSLGQFDVDYHGPVTRDLSFQAQKKMASSGKSQAQIMQALLPPDPATAYANLTEEMDAPAPMLKLAALPAYSPPSPPTATAMRLGMC